MPVSSGVERHFGHAIGRHSLPILVWQYADDCHDGSGDLTAVRLHEELRRLDFEGR
jgi:hypothetical protein